MKTIIIHAFILIFLISSLKPVLNLYAQDQAQEVKSLTAVVEVKLGKVKNTVAVNFAQEEINIVESYITETKRLIKEKEYQRAYYVISIAISYFNLISARLELNEAQEEFKKIKEKLHD